MIDLLSFSLTLSLTVNHAFLGRFGTKERETDVILLIEDSEFALKSCVHLRPVQCHLQLI